MPRIKAAILTLSLATLSVPAFSQGTDPAVRDTSAALNYVQGQATLDGQPVTTDAATSSPRQLHSGDVLATTAGSADVMLTPGSLLRVGGGTNVQFVAVQGDRTEVRLENGRADVAVNTLRQNHLVLVDLPDGQTQILERGLYSFDTAGETVRVFNGEADVFPGSSTQTSVKPVKVKEEHEVVLSDNRVKPVKFERADMQGTLLPWTGPQEAHADGDYGLPAQTQGNSEPGYSAVAYGFGAEPYGSGYGWGYPYGLYGYPYGFYGYPFGIGVGFGYGGLYRGGYYGRGYGYGGYRGGFVGGFGGGVAGARGFGGGGFHGGGGGRR